MSNKDQVGFQTKDPSNRQFKPSPSYSKIRDIVTVCVTTVSNTTQTTDIGNKIDPNDFQYNKHFGPFKDTKAVTKNLNNAAPTTNRNTKPPGHADNNDNTLTTTLTTP